MRRVKSNSCWNKFGPPVLVAIEQLLFIVSKVIGATRHNRLCPWNGETVSRNIIHWKWNQKWRHFKFAEHSCEFHKKDFFYPHFIGDLYWGSPTQMKKPSEKLVNLPMDTSLVSAGVGIWPDLFPSKSHAIHTGCKSLVIISIVTEAKCWFVHI